MFASTTFRRQLALSAISLYWLALFILTHWPGDPHHRPSDIPHLDKLLHAGGFFGLALLVCLAISVFRTPRTFTLLAVVAVLAVYAALDEWTQGAVRLRQPDVQDWIADVVGLSCGVAIFVVCRRVGRGGRHGAVSAAG